MGVLYGLIGFDDFVVGYLAVIDADPFIKTYQVWRCVKTDAVTGFVKNGGKHSGHRTFAVGPRHMDAGIIHVGVAEAFEYASNCFQAEYDPESSETIHGI